MPAPTNSDLKYYNGADPTPNDDTDNLGGAIDTSPELDQTDEDLLIADISIPASGGNISYYGVAYRKNESTGDLLSARLAIRTGMKFNTGAGAAQLVSTSASDVGDVVLTGKVSGVWTQETVTLTGTTPVVSSNTWDASGLYRVDYNQIPVGNVTVSVAAQTVGVLWKTVTRSSVTILGTIMCTVEFALAVCTAKDTTLSSTDRLTAPGSISAFSQATRWSGSDTSIAVPSGSLLNGEWIGYTIRLIAYEDIFPTVGGDLICDVELVGTPIA